MKDRILLFIPAYNCEKQITRVLEQLDASVMRYIDEVIVVITAALTAQKRQSLITWSIIGRCLSYF